MALEHGQNGRPPVFAAPISRVVAVINPVSGAGLDSSATTTRVAIVRESLARVGLAPIVHVTERAGHARELAAAAVRDAADLLIVWGGDGTFNEAASALVGSATSLGLIPAGSGNGLAASLGVPRAPEAALQHLLSTPPRAVDVGTFAGRPFFNIAGIGLDAHIARLFNQRGRGRRGKWPYVAIGVREGWTYKARRYQSARRQSPHGLRVASGLRQRARGHMGACISPGARLDDGWLDATVVEDRPAVARFLDARHLATRTINRARRVLLRQVRSAMVSAEEPMQVSPRRRAWSDRGCRRDRDDAGRAPRPGVSGDGAETPMRTDEFIDVCKSGDLERVRQLLAEDPALAGARAPEGETPVIAALYRGHAAVVELLLAAGAPLDIYAGAALGRRKVVEERLAASPQSIDSRLYDGWTPLHLAAFFGEVVVLQHLLAQGADVNAISTNSIANTPLHAAVAGGRVEAALALIDAGADVNARDGGGHTPFHIAAEGGYVPIVEALLRHNADPHAVDAEDRTPLARAAARNHSAVVDLINLSKS